MDVDEPGRYDQPSRVNHAFRVVRKLRSDSGNAIVGDRYVRTEPPRSRPIDHGAVLDQQRPGHWRSACLDSARARTGIGFRKMSMHHAPQAVLLVKYHRGSGDELFALVVNFTRRPVLADPIAIGVAVAPDYRHFIGNDAADIERCPV